jgi:hypothetical protein
MAVIRSLVWILLFKLKLRTLLMSHSPSTLVFLLPMRVLNAGESLRSSSLLVSS